MTPESIEALRRPDAYPHPITTVEIVETHISWILLTGEFAYKIKKPVDLGFVDFSSADKRHRYCLEELRLNRRTAPQLYLDVVPITGTPEKPRLFGQGTPFDYAVKMKQFDRSMELDRLVEKGSLDPDAVSRFGTTLADFHDRANVAQIDTTFGTTDTIARHALENFIQSAPCVRQSADRDALNQLETACREAIDRFDSEFIERKRSGRVRECHGDMHLANMVLLDGVVVPFDCLEFNPDLRWVDVISELAFTLMDFFYRGYPELAFRLLNHYLEASGDYEGIVVLRFYLCYRAMVRAKVACLRERQHAESDDTQEFFGYLALARRFLKIQPAPFLIITHGFSGSGKSTYARVLSETLGAIVIRSDVVRKRLQGLAPTQKSDSALDGGLYDASITEATYERLLDLSDKILRSGYSVCVDATFLKQSQRKCFEDYATSRRTPFLILHFAADDAVLRQRIVLRAALGADASEADTSVLDAQQANHEPLDAAERRLCFEVDALPPEQIMESVQRLAEMMRERTGATSEAP